MAPIAICLYSKYSQRCKEFMDDVPEELGIQMLCIDNKDVRAKVLKDENGYHIKTVPCMFVFFQNGRLEKYEGSDAFVWLRKQLDLDSDADMDSPPPPPPRQTIAKQTPQRKRMSAAAVTRLPANILELPDTDDEDDDLEQEQERFIPQQESPNDTNSQLSSPFAQSTEEMRASDQIMTRKQDNIKELAQAMQRQRESEEEQMNPPPPGSPAAAMSSM